MSKADLPLREILEATHWITQMPSSVRERVFIDAYEKFYEPGALVIQKGDPARAWVGVGEGLLKVSTVHRSGKVVMFSALPQGSWAGEGTVFNRELYRYDMIAMRPSRVVFIPSATFRWLLDTSIEFCHLILSRLNARLGTVMAMVEFERMVDPTSRVACMIGIMFHEMLHPRIGPLLELSQSELGELTGMSRQSVNSALKSLEKRGLVATGYGGIVVKNLSGLINYADMT